MIDWTHQRVQLEIWGPDVTPPGETRSHGRYSTTRNPPSLVEGDKEDPNSDANKDTGSETEKDGGESRTKKTKWSTCRLSGWLTMNQNIR